MSDKKRWKEELSFKESQFVTMSYSNMQACVFPVAIHENGGIRHVGTAFHIGAGLAVTARHVVDHVIDVEGVMRGERELGLIWTGMTPLPPDERQDLELPIQWLAVRHISILEGYDLALVAFDVPANDNGQPLTLQFPLDFTAPVVGSDTIAFGYTKYSWAGVDDIAGLDIQFHVSQGKVEAIFPKTHPLRPWPCFQNDARYDHSMSGGPVFSERGRVVGVVCSSLASTGEGDPHTSLASLLLPLLMMQVPGGQEGETLMSLIAEGHITHNGSADGYVILIHEDGSRGIGHRRPSSNSD